MSDQSHLSKSHLLDEINSAWTAVNDALDALTAEQITGPTDTAGWTVADHLTHLAAWADWAAGMVDGIPGWQALGIPESAYGGDMDAENEAIRQHRAAPSAAAARAGLQQAHGRVLDRLVALTEAQLAAPYRERREGDAPEQAIASLGEVIHAETADHYREHLPWMQTLADDR